MTNDKGEDHKVIKISADSLEQDARSTRPAADPKSVAYTLETRDGSLAFYGRVIGYGSSWRSQHTKNGHDLTRDTVANEFMHYARRGQFCPACRWQDVRIFSVSADRNGETPDAPFLVYILGPSIVPTETTFSRFEWAHTGYEIIEILTVKKPGATPYLPVPAARALAQAAGFNRQIERAYLERSASTHYA